MIIKEIKLVRKYNGLQLAMGIAGIENTKMFDKTIPVSVVIEEGDTDETLSGKLETALQEKIDKEIG